MNQKIILGTQTITSFIISKLIPSELYRASFSSYGCGKKKKYDSLGIYFDAFWVWFSLKGKVHPKLIV